MTIYKTLYKIFFIGFFFLILSSNPSEAFAATYYVATTGNDSYTTTQAEDPATPWQTLRGAQTNATDGDTINVDAGTYTDSTNYLNLYKAITWNAIGEVIVHSAASESLRVINIAGTGPLVLNGFTLDGEGTKTSIVQFSSNGVVNKTLNNVTLQNSTGLMVNMPGVSDITIQNSTFRMLPTSSAISITNTAGDVIITGNTFNFPSGNTGLISRAATTGTLQFTDNTLTGAGGGNLFYITGGGDISFNNNNITLTAAVGTIILTNGGGGVFDLKDNVITYTKSTNEGLYFNAGTWDLDIDGNTITSTGTDMTFAVIAITDQYSPMIQNNVIDTLATNSRGQLFIRSTGVEGGTLHIRGNTLKSRSDSMVINIGTDTPNAGSTKMNGAIIENNILYGPIYFDPFAVSADTHGIFYSQNVNGIIRYNTIIGMGFGVVIKGTGESYSSGGVYYNKIINSNATASIRIKGVKDVPIYNNSLYSNSTLTSRLVYITQYNAGETATGARVKNNILYCANCNPIEIGNDGSEVGFISNNNLFYRDTGSTIGVIAGITYSNLTNWRAAGYDLLGLFANPSFSDIGTSNLALLSSSPAINNGTALGETRDMLGTIIYGIPDIGAYEYIDVNPPSVTLSPIGSVIHDNTPIFSGVATDVHNYITGVEYSIDGGAWSTSWLSATDGSLNSASEAFTITVPVESKLVDGSHTIRVRAIDSLSNTSTYATSSFIVETSLSISKIGTLTYTIAGTYYYTGLSPTFTGASESGSTVTLMVNGHGVDVTDSVGSDGSWSLSGYHFTQGSYLVTIISTNPSSSTTTTTFTLVIDPSASLFPLEILQLIYGTSFTQSVEASEEVVEETTTDVNETDQEEEDTTNEDTNVTQAETEEESSPTKEKTSSIFKYSWILLIFIPVIWWGMLKK